MIVIKQQGKKFQYRWSEIINVHIKKQWGYRGWWPPQEILQQKLIIKTFDQIFCIRLDWIDSHSQHNKPLVEEIKKFTHVVDPAIPNYYLGLQYHALKVVLLAALFGMIFCELFHLWP